MEKLGFQDAAFLQLESAQRPFHVAGLMLLKLPQPTPRGYLRSLARRCGRLNELWPVFNKQLSDPDATRNLQWVKADNYDPASHVFHYALPAPGREDDLLSLVTRAHERPLDRHRPLWELHIIEGLPDGRFALYCKVHHALMDGVSALGMMDALFSHSPRRGISFGTARPRVEAQEQHRSVLGRLRATRRELEAHYRAIPQISSLLAAMTRNTLAGRPDVPQLPFTAPRTLFNTNIDARRAVVIADLPLAGVRKIGRNHGGTINDVIVAICGGALREYLQHQDSLPKQSLEAGVPVSIRRGGEQGGNQVGFIICPFHTEIRDPVRRLRRVIKVTSRAKSDMRNLSKTAATDYTNALMMPTLLLTLTGNASRVKPALNAIVSNVPGSREQLYLDGAALERVYPLSVVTDGLGLNITVISYMNTLCFALTSCPTQQPDIESLGKLIRQSYRELSRSAG